MRQYSGSSFALHLQPQWARAWGLGRGKVQSMVMLGSPRNFLTAKAYTSYAGSDLTFNPAKHAAQKDPVAAIGNPLYAPSAILWTIKCGCLAHGVQDYQPASP